MTKKCKSCQTDIDAKASKCPNCKADQRNWFRRHPILTGIIVLVVVSIVMSGASSSKSGSSSDNGQATTTSSDSNQKPAEPMKITARELADDFDANQVAAENKWKGKLVEFSALISNITDSGLSFSKVTTKEFSMTQISCRVKDKNQLMPLKNEQNVTVRGVVGDQTVGVIDISDCEVVQ